jgi:hypothetical protein
MEICENYQCIIIKDAITYPNELWFYEDYNFGYRLDSFWQFKNNNFAEFNVKMKIINKKYEITLKAKTTFNFWFLFHLMFVLVVFKIFCSWLMRIFFRYYYTDNNIKISKFFDWYLSIYINSKQHALKFSNSKWKGWYWVFGLNASNH